MTKIRAAPKWGVCLNYLNILLNLFSVYVSYLIFNMIKGMILMLK